MTSLLARLGHSFDTRRAAQTFLTTAGKRKRGHTTQWVCAECRARRTGSVQRQQFRGYSDGGIRLGAEEYLFPQQGENEADSRGERSERGGWGMRRGEAQEGVGRDNMQGTPDVMATPEQEREDMWEQTEIAQEVEDDEAAETSSYLSSATTEDDYETAAFRYQPLLKIDYKNELSGALLRAETDVVFRCLFAAHQANDLDFVKAIPTTTFSEIIRLADPRRFVSKLASAHLELSSFMVKSMHVAPIHSVAFEYVSIIRSMLGIRKSSGVPLTLGDYTLLLRAARDLGNRRLGALLWSNMLQEGYRPNTQCYNYMMSAIVWNGMHSAGSRHKVRVIPFNMLGRKNAKLSRFQNYGVGPGGVRETALNIFNEMLANGAYADQESFRILMTAAGREGDLQTVKSILMKVWNIDVEGIMAGTPESSILPKQRAQHSPLRPTKDLLYTLAHIFGINNDIPTALRVVDFVARHYQLELDAQTWGQLFEWTFVLAMDRLNAARRRGTDIGHLPPESLLNLWETMTSPPYSFEPTMGMYNYLIKHLFRHRWVPQMSLRMHEANKLYREHRDKAKKLFRQLQRATNRPDDGPQERFYRSAKSLESLRNKFEVADLIRQRDIFWIKRWVRLFLGVHRHHVKNDHYMESVVRTLPKLLWRWRRYAPTKVRYETHTGLVEFKIRSDETMLENADWAFVRRSEIQGITSASPKLVGQRWVRGGEAKKSKRLLDHVDEEGFFNDTEDSEA